MQVNQLSSICVAVELLQHAVNRKWMWLHGNVNRVISKVSPLKRSDGRDIGDRKT